MARFRAASCPGRGRPVAEKIGDKIPHCTDCKLNLEHCGEVKHETRYASFDYYVEHHFGVNSTIGPIDIQFSKLCGDL